MVAGEDHAAAEVEIRRDAASRIKKPFESERVDARAINHAAGLKDEIQRHRIDGVFKPAAQDAGAV